MNDNDPASDVRLVSQRNISHDIEFDPEEDDYEWKVLDPADYPVKIRKIEQGYPIFPDQFIEIASLMSPSEVQTRMGDEIRFVWNWESGREILQFNRPCDADHPPQRILFNFYAEACGRESISINDVTDEFVVRPLFRSAEPSVGLIVRPPYIQFILDQRSSDFYTKIATVIVRRGYGNSNMNRRHVNCVWVG